MKRSLVVMAVVTLAVAFLFAGVYATQEAPDVITLESKVYDKHSKSLVDFTHKKHSVDYKIACDQCHHVYKDGKNVWKEGDEVQKCDACHSEAKPPRAESRDMSKKEKIAGYHYYAIHENCKGCHKDLKKEGKPTGPTTCSDCHPREKK